MVSEIRRKLTTLYTFVFGVLLFIFTGFVCIWLIWGTYSERSNEIRLLANEIAREQRSIIVEYYKATNFIPQTAPLEDNYDISGQVFYYILAVDGNVIKADLSVPVLRDVVQSQIMNWDSAKETDFVKVTLPNGETAVLALAMHQVYKNDELIATVYAGRDVTAYSRGLIRTLFTIMGAAIGFLFIAAYIGYFLAGRVIVPIEKSIIRQRQFVADASHELRNPLSILLTSFEAIEMDTDSILSSFSRQILIDAKDEFFRLRGMVNDLLTLARTDSGEIVLKKERFELNIVADQVIHALKTAAEQKQISVNLSTLESIKINADPDRIYQLLYILVDNGIKYTKSGEVLIYLEQVQKNKQSFVKIIVQDTGPGISPEIQHHIFERFFRGDEARSRDIEGSGLGLSIAKWIVDAHHGEISIQSEEAKGSQFIIKIPDLL